MYAVNCRCSVVRQPKRTSCFAYADDDDGDGDGDGDVEFVDIPG